MDMLAKAIQLAGTYHAGQFDKAGKPYITHILAVVANAQRLAEMMPFTNVIDVMTIAALHDLVEDTPVTLDALVCEHGFSDDIVKSVAALTKLKGENYEVFIARCCAGDMSTRLVKMADIEHNIDVLRLNPDKIEQVDLDRLVKYRAAYARLKRAQLERMDAWDD